MDDSIPDLIRKLLEDREDPIRAIGFLSMDTNWLGMAHLLANKGLG